jgi:acyl-CoA synthetase (AMP-forming)/AMP-acid ligase II
MSIFKILKKNSTNHPNKVALIIDERKYSYKEFFNLVLNTIKNLKENSFTENSVVLIIEENNLSYILSLFALSYLNSTIIPAGKYYTNENLFEIAKRTNVNCVISNKGYCSYFKKKLKIKNYLCTSDTKKFSFFFKINNNKISLKKKTNINKNFIITLSSGSTAKPKPIIYSQRTKIIRYNLFRDLYKINKKDTIIVTSPIYHSLGMRVLLLPLLAGGTCVLMRKFNIHDYFTLVKKNKVTFSVLVANQIYELVKEKSYFKNFYLKKGLVSASAKLFNFSKKKLIKKKINLYEMYGAAEIGTVTNINISKNKKFFKSVGKTYHKNIDIKILSSENKLLPNNKIGEIICKTPGIFKGYLGLTKENKCCYYRGYFKTGDLGYLDKDKYLYFKSRKKNIIRKNGITIYPEDIENILLKDKKIEEVAVVGKELAFNTKIYLFINRRKNIDHLYIKNICLKKLSTFQLPDEIIFLKNIPKTNLGKINKRELLTKIK